MSASFIHPFANVVNKRVKKADDILSIAPRSISPVYTRRDIFTWEIFCIFLVAGIITFRENMARVTDISYSCWVFTSSALQRNTFRSNLNFKFEAKVVKSLVECHQVRIYCKAGVVLALHISVCCTGTGHVGCLKAPSKRRLLRIQLYHLVLDT